MGRVVHFEIPAGDTKRAVDFYGKVFGWKFEKWPGPMEYWMVSTGDAGAPGINGGLLPNGSTVKSTTNTIEVQSVDTAATAVKNAGGKQLSPKNAIPGVGYFAYCEDTEGNVFGVMQNDTNAT
jgi:uncharacterized protein